MIREYEGYQIKPNKNFPNNLTIATAGKGGSIPSDLSGMYTSVEVAKQAIDKYRLKLKEMEEALKQAEKEVLALQELEKQAQAQAATEAKKEEKRSKKNAEEKPTSGDK